MGSPLEAVRCVCFGEFTLNPRTGELRVNGTISYLQDKPLQVLVLLLEHPGQLVTRAELMKRLWSTDTFVDFDQSLNKAVNRLREALAVALLLREAAVERSAAAIRGGAAFGDSSASAIDSWSSANNSR